MLAGPAFVNFGETEAGLFAQADELKHLLEVSISAIAGAASDRIGQGDAQDARISKPEEIRTFHDQDGAVAGVVRVNERVYQCLAERLVHRCILDPLVTLQGKGHFEPGRQLRVNLSVEIIKVTRPGKIRRQTIHPPGLRHRAWTLLIIDDVAGDGIEDRTQLPEHKKTGDREPFPAGLSILTMAPELLEKLQGIEVVQHMRGLPVGEILAIDAQAFHVHVGEAEAFQQRAILRVTHTLSKHVLHHLAGAVIISLVVAPKCAGERVAPDMHRTRLAVGPGDLHEDDRRVADLPSGDVTIGKQVDADDLRIVGLIEQRLDDFFAIEHSYRDRDLIHFFNAQDDAAAIGVRHGGITFPKRLGQFAAPVPAMGGFEFQIDPLVEVLEVEEIVLGSRIHGLTVKI
jgi:hypothetical protein